MSKVLPGYKTVLFNGLIAVLGAAITALTLFLDTVDWSTVVDAQYAGIVVTLVAVVNIGLRAITRSPMFKAPDVPAAPARLDAADAAATSVRGPDPFERP